MIVKDKLILFVIFQYTGFYPLSRAISVWLYGRIILSDNPIDSGSAPTPSYWYIQSTIGVHYVLG
jgi:hypothetical protein